MISFLFVFWFGQVFAPNSVSPLPEGEKAAIRDAAGTYWRSWQGSNVWLLPLVSWDMNPAGRPRPLTNWTRIVGRATLQSSHWVINQDPGRTPPMLALTNLPPDRIRAQRVNAYAAVRPSEFVNYNGRPIPVYDFGKIIDPPGRTSAVRTNAVPNPPAPRRIRPAP